MAQTVKLLSSTGAAAVTIHGRTMEQRYKKPADWSLISTTAQAAAVPVIGNGDILTYYEVRQMRRHPQASGHMLSSVLQVCVCSLLLNCCP